MATSVSRPGIQPAAKDAGAGIALSADATRLRATEGSAATLACQEASAPDALLPVFDLADYLSGREDPAASAAQCRAVAECLRGAVADRLLRCPS